MLLEKQGNLEHKMSGTYKVIKTNRDRRKFRIRKKISGTAEIPRLSVYKSLSTLYAQAINDDEGMTLVASMTKSKKSVEEAKKLGVEFAEKAKAKKISKIVFDRNGFAYHGVIKAFAESLREQGIEF